MKVFSTLALTSLTLYSGIVLASNFAALDEALPRDIDIRSIAPVFDFDTDGCLPSAGISRNGEKNGGLKPSGEMGGQCRDENFLLTSNTLHRHICVARPDANYCGHIFGLYFKKDQLFPIIESGHRHDWEFAAVFTKDGVITHVSYSSHGDVITAPINEVPTQQGHPKVVYHKDGISTHVFRFAKANEIAENSYGTFVTPPITSWFEIYGDGISNAEMRDKLTRYDYGKANVPTTDGNFFRYLEKGKPSDYPALTD